MPTNQLTRLVWRQDQLLQLPFPKPPSLAQHVNGVLKIEGAVAYDTAQQKDREAVQNILRQALRFPKIEELQRQIDELEASLQPPTDLTALTALVNAQAALISALQSALLSLTSFANGLQTQITTLVANQVPQRGNGPPDGSVIARYDGDEYWDMDGGPGTYRWNESTSEWLSL